MSGPGEKEKLVVTAGAEKSDAEELREVLKAVSEFLKELSPTLKDLVNAVLGALNGETLGREVGAFYRSLLEAGVKEETATWLAEVFIKRKMELAAQLVQYARQVHVPRKEVEVVEKKAPEEGG